MSSRHSARRHRRSTPRPDLRRSVRRRSSDETDSHLPRTFGSHEGAASLRSGCGGIVDPATSPSREPAGGLLYASAVMAIDMVLTKLALAMQLHAAVPALSPPEAFEHASLAI